MKVSVLDLYTIGLGPSSSHTVGPMRAAARFAAAALPLRPARVRIDLYGSLALTGKGHGTHLALVAGLHGHQPETVDPAFLATAWAEAEAVAQVPLGGLLPVAFDPRHDLVFHRRHALPFHPNGLRCEALDADDHVLLTMTMYSIGGGFVITEGEKAPPTPDPVPFPFHDAASLLAAAARAGGPISRLVLANEDAWRPRAETTAQLDRIWAAMQACVARGLATEGTLPGGLKVPRRAPGLHRALTNAPPGSAADPLDLLDWVNVWAMAVNEENAAGGRVVTAPTNGAAGILPAVLHYAERVLVDPPPHWHRAFLLTAGAIGLLFKENASLSGADVGCQGEVGVACSMAAGALTEVLGGSPAQVENAAEIGMEHNLGLTCDPVGGLVQIPCIERNAMGAVKAINAARLARRGDGRHTVSLDAVIRTMRDTGRDMRRQYKETSQGGLAVNVVEC